MKIKYNQFQAYLYLLFEMKFRKIRERSRPKSELIILPSKVEVSRSFNHSISLISTYESSEKFSKISWSKLLSFQSSKSLNYSRENIFDSQNSDPTGYRNGPTSSSNSLAPPMPPIAPAARLRRANSSTLSLTKNKRKMLTVIIHRQYLLNNLKHL